MERARRELIPIAPQHCLKAARMREFNGRLHGFTLIASVDLI